MTTRRYSASTSLSQLNADLAQETDAWEVKTRCAACNGFSISEFASIRRIRYARCKECGCVFANPSPPNSVLSEFYNSDFYNNYRILEEDVISESPYFSISAYRDLRHIASWIERDRSAAILDFGCGPGSFLALLRDEFGYKNVEGLELNQHSAQLALRQYGLNIAQDIGSLRNEKFDLIILFETIEHLRDPDHVISTCSHLLNPGGALFITTPSVRNIPARAFPSHCGHYTGPSHISLFTELALTRLLSRHDLTIRRLETDPASQLLGNYIARPFYDLDFASPRASNDFDDRLFIPTALGRALKLQPARSLGPALKIALRLDHVLAGLWQKATGRSYSDHLYVLAYKNG